MNMINDVMKKRMKSKGMIKGQDRYLNYKFEEFDIMDMYRDKDGNVCYPCAYGKRC